jgi:hypothetical protein
LAAITDIRSFTQPIANFFAIVRTKILTFVTVATQLAGAGEFSFTDIFESAGGSIEAVIKFSAIAAGFRLLNMPSDFPAY